MSNGEAPARRGWLLMVVALAALLGVASCTGTQEPELPTLLIVGVEEDGAPQLALIEDLGSAAPRGERFAFIEASRRALPAPAVSLDFTSREAERGSAWVLTRSVAAGGGGQRVVSAALQEFTVREIDPANPRAFAATGGSMPLVTPAGDGLLQLASSGERTHCPTEVQSSRAGDWLLLLDLPRACNPASSEFPAIWLVNARSRTATSLQEGNDVLGLRPYTDQAPERERGYFLVAGTSAAQVYAVDEGASPSYWFNQLQLEARPEQLVAAAGSGPVLVGLTSDALLGAALDEQSAPLELGPVNTIPEPLDVLVDPLGAAPRLLVLAARQVGVHLDLDPEREEPDVAPFAAAAGAIDPLSYFGYLLGERRLMLIDLLSGAAQEERLRYSTFELPELTLPRSPTGAPLTVAAWVRAAERPPAP